MYPPGAEVVGKTAAKGVWALVRSWLKGKGELEHQIAERDKQIRELEAELAEERSGKLAFERLKSELECRPEDDGMYWRKDGKGGPYCPLCLDADHKLIQLTRGGGEGAFYCRLHEHTFETDERRQRVRQAIQDRAQGARRKRYGTWS